MARKRAETHFLKGEKALAALSSPVRLEILGELKAVGPCAIRDLAARMDRPADGLYHHIKALIKAGAVVQTGSRASGGRTEALFGLIAPRIAGALDASSPRSRRAVIRAASATLRLASREFAAAIEAGEGSGKNRRKDIRVSRQKTWLNAKAVRELTELLTRIEELLSKHAEAKEGRPYALTIGLVPLPTNMRGA